MAEGSTMTDKWGRRLFTMGALLLLLMGVVHSLSLFGKAVPANDTERQLLELMANYKFNLMGSMRSMDKLLRGFSISFMIAIIGLGVLDFSLRRERPELLRRVVLINTIWLAAMLAISLRYFFVLPTTFLGTSIVIFGLAWLKLKSDHP